MSDQALYALRCLENLTSFDLQNLHQEILYMQKYHENGNKMIERAKKIESPKKRQGLTGVDDKNSKQASSSSSAWLRLKDPRIVRVSRAFGGKDRHSKVCTIRGLRDRRVRLSVPTAINLYDLQDRLGLNQPSKVVDWLLNAAKHEIDELPPLPIPPSAFALNHHQALLNSSLHQVSTAAAHSNKGFKLNNLEDLGGGAAASRGIFWNSDALFKVKSKEVRDFKRNNEEEEEKKKESSNGNERGATQVSSSQGLINSNNNNNIMSYGSFFSLEAPNFPCPQLCGDHGFASQTTEEDLHNLNVVPPQPPLTTQTYLPSHGGTTSMEIDPRSSVQLINHFQMLPTASSFNPPYSITTQSSTRPFHFSFTPNKLHYSSQNQLDKEDQE